MFNCVFYKKNLTESTSITPVSTDDSQNKRVETGSKLHSFLAFLEAFCYRRGQSDALSNKSELVLAFFYKEHRSETVCRKSFFRYFLSKERSFDTHNLCVKDKALRAGNTKSFRRKSNFHVFFLLFFISLNLSLSAQSTALSFKEKNIADILNKLEKTGDWVFNYDPTELSKYTYTGQLNQGNITTQLTQLFYRTPYIFEQSESTFLVYLETPKTYRICGTLKDELSKTTLPLANIFLDDQKQGTQTDADGHFDFDFTAHKHQILSISYIGYESQSFMIQEMESNDCSDFLLKIDPALFGAEIIVKDYILQEITEGETYNSVRIDYQKLLNKYTIIEQDVLKTVQLIPGINSADESATNLQIRGSTPDQNLIVWEDITLYDPGHLFGMISAINPYVIEEVQVFKGVFDPRYDNRVGGIIDLSLGDSLHHQFQGSIGSTLTEAHAFVKVPIIKNKLALTLSGRNTINGLWNSPTITNYSNKVFQDTRINEEQEEVQEGDRAAQQQLNFYDLNTKVIFKPLPNWTLKGSWFRTHNTFIYESEFLEEELISKDDVFFDTQAYNVSSQFTIQSDWQLKLGYSSSAYGNDYNFSLADAGDDLIFFNNNVTNNILDQTYFVNVDYKWSPFLSFSAGYDYNIKEVNFNIDIEDETPEESMEDLNSLTGHFHNAFIGFSFQQEKWRINGGLRNTYYQDLQQNQISPRLNLQYGVSKNLKLKLSGGIFYQYISQLKEFGDNDLGLNNQVWIINQVAGDEVEEVQSAKKVAGGIVFHNKGWLVDVEAYFNQTDGLSTFNPTFNSSAGNELDFSLGSSRAKGLDFLIKKRWREYHVWLNYSLSKVNFNFPDIDDNAAFPASNDQRHQLSLVNTWTYKNWNFSLNYQFKTGLPFTQALEVEEATEFNEEEEIEETFSFIEFGEPNGQKLKNYSRLDLGVSYRPKFKNTNLQAEITFSLINLLNANNIFSRDSFIDDSEEDDPILFEVNRRLLKRTPLVSARVYW